MTHRRPDLCGDCDEPLEPHDGAPEDRPRCPECGSTNRKIRASQTEVVGVSDQIGVARIREWIETNWALLLAASTLSAAGLLLAGIVGLLLGAAAVPVGAYAFTKVQEIDRQ